jgi:hypothetical protein
MRNAFADRGRVLNSRAVRDKRDSRKKRFIGKLAKQGTVSHAAQAAGVSRNTAYRWRQDDLEFAEAWDEAHENAVDSVENVLFQKALSGDTICMIFYLKAHRPIYRDRLNIDIAQVKSEIEERMAQLRANPDLLARGLPALRE